MVKRITFVALILLAPLSMIAAALYEILSGKSRPIFYLLLVAFPGAVLAAWKELKDSGLLPPAKLKLQIDATRATVNRWQQAMIGGNVIRQVTDIVIPLRIENTDPSNALHILDVAISSNVKDAQLEIPQMFEIQVGSEKKWVYPFSKGAYEGLFNDASQKLIAAKSISDFIIGVCEYDRTHQEYSVHITFRDNWNRTYSHDVIIAAP